MADGGGTDWGLPGFDALQKIHPVIFGFINLYVIRAEFVADKILRRCFNFVAADQNFTLAADEANHVPVAGLPVARYGDAIGISVGIMLRTLKTLGNEFDRTSVVPIKRPLNNVIVVRTPISQLSVAIVPITTPASTVFPFHPVFRILGKWRRSQPAIVAESLWHRNDDLFLRRWWKITQTAVDLLDGADHSVAHKIHGNPEINRGPLLATHL
jgi:hypothetical protein